MTAMKHLSVADYAVFFGSLVAALAIGIWQAVKYRHDSQKDMLVISSGMHLVPITLSLMATYLSAILILGTPAEIYANGSEWTTSILGFLIGIPLATVVFVPIFYKLKLTSVNEYFELRFRSKAVRILGSFLFLAQNLLYMGVALWAPVIAISSVTSMPEWVAILTAGGICTIYTAVGGLRAVVWTDAFQVVVMFLGLLVIIVYGTIQVGGAGEVWRIASENDRANLFNISFDPYERHSFLWILLNTGIAWMLIHGANQSSVQRYSSCKTLNQAIITLMLNVPGVIILVLMACIAGLVLFANYVHCDPLKAGIIKSKDQIIPFFVVDQLGDLSGLPGLFMACLFSGALSTLSSGLNSLAAITWEDGIKQTKWGENLSESQASWITKALGVVYGLISIGLSFIAGKFGGVLQVCITVTSVLAAPALTLFVAAVLLPFVNVPGVFAGSAVSLFVSGFLGFGSYIDGVPGPVPLKSFVEICPPDWDVSEIAFSNSSVSAPVEDWNELGFRKIFRISYLLYMCTGLLFGLIVTIITSLATGGYPEDQIDSSIVHSWSIDFFKWLKAKSGISKISHTSASSYNFELKNAGMAGSKSTETMYPTASTATLVTRVGDLPEAESHATSSINKPRHPKSDKFSSNGNFY